MSSVKGGPRIYDGKDLLWGEIRKCQIMLR